MAALLGVLPGRAFALAALSAVALAVAPWPSAMTHGRWVNAPSTVAEPSFVPAHRPRPKAGTQTGLSMVRRIPHDTSATPVERLAARDTQYTARSHIAHLPEGFFPQLGEAFVRRWHRTFIDSPSAVAFGIRDRDGRVAAFVLATTDQHAYVRDVLARNRFALAGRAAIGLMMHPAAANRFVRTRAKHYAYKLWAMRHVSDISACRWTGTDGGATDAAHAVVTPGAGPTPVGVVHAIATEPHLRGKGFGRLLLSRYEAELTSVGTPRGLLITSATNSAANLYRGLGWRETERRVDRDGRTVLQFERTLHHP